MFVIIGLFISRWDAARNGRKGQVSVLENWVALAVAAAIFYVGFDIVREVLGGEAPELKNLAPVTLASLVTVAAAYFIARYKLYVGRQTNSPALVAGGYHSQMDIYAAIVVVVGLAGAALGLPRPRSRRRRRRGGFYHVFRLRDRFVGYRGHHAP